MAPQFGIDHPVTVVRDARTPNETRFDAKMGGDLARKALFYLDDRVRTGDEIHYELFDEPRVIGRVSPALTQSGPSHWEAEIMPMSEWKRRTAPSGTIVHVIGQGGKVNINSVDQSLQHFQNQAQGDVARLLEEIRTSIEQLAATDAEKADARISVEQVSMELQRSTPDKTLLWKLLERLNTFGGLVEKGAKLAEALQNSGILQ